ncbi:hypothetical protein GE061_017552 [Apolygus lucorum]|uniref:Uncharacterized protein n=1 Tax=Apolygus lucorum TaxID=248454 RepID=A0A8S9XDE3_APOLU|nr:hypothetical protein GE061_017552 [Apolygus lucorum]
MFALNAKNIGIADFMDFMRKNVYSLVVWTWYATIAVSCCITCILMRVLLIMIRGKEEGGPLMAILFNGGLAAATSLLLEAVDEIDLGSYNTPFEEVILSSTAGYYFYEMFYLHTRKSIEPCLKILSMISATALIMTTLGNGSGGKVVLTFIFIFSSTVPVLKLPYFGSSKFENTTAYKAAVWISPVFAIHQRVFQAPGLFLKFWNSPAFRFEQFECAYYIALYSLAIGVCFCLTEIVLKMQKEKEKIGFEDETFKINAVNRELVTCRRGKRTYAHE